MNIHSWIFDSTFSFLKLLLSQTYIPLVTIHLHPCSPHPHPWPLGGSVTLFGFRFLFGLFCISLPVCVGNKKVCCEEAKPPHHWRHWSLMIMTDFINCQTSRGLQFESPDQTSVRVGWGDNGSLSVPPNQSSHFVTVAWVSPPSLPSSIVCEPAEAMKTGKTDPERERWLPPAWYCFQVLSCTVAIQIIGYGAKYGIVSQLGLFGGRLFKFQPMREIGIDLKTWMNKSSLITVWKKYVQ